MILAQQRYGCYQGVIPPHVTAALLQFGESSC